MSSPARYAIYYTPDPQSPLAAFGAAAIGYDVAAAADVPFLQLEGISIDELMAATAAPRKYGFHATLVAPFHLGGASVGDLLAGFNHFCNELGPVSLGTLEVCILRDFVALVPQKDNPALDELARRCVAFFDVFRAQMTREDFIRRASMPLSPRQRANLKRWGYPYVFEDFRFHMTLTGRLSEADSERFHLAFTRAYAPWAWKGYDVEALSLLRQPQPGARFEMVARRLLRGCQNGAVGPVKPRI